MSDIDWAPCPPFESVVVDEETLRALTAAPFALLPHDVRVESVNWKREHDICVQQRDAAIARAEASEREVAAWTESARHFSANVDYYQGIVDKIGELLGIEARTQDDGNVVDGILRAKVYELVKIRLVEAIARTEAAEIQKASRFTTPEVEAIIGHWKARVLTAEQRLAERDASAKRWVRLGCVLALLLPLTAHAADAPPAPPQPTLEQQVNADEATIMTARTKEAAIVDTWRSAIVSLGNQRDILQAQVTVISKERDALKDELAKAKVEPPRDKPGG